MTTPIDKKMHFWAGVSISILALVFFKAIEIKHCPIWVFSTVILASVGKEVKDYLDYGRPDWKDAVYTIIGGLAGFILSFF